MSTEGRYEPLPRWGHSSVAIGDRIYLWGGRTDEFSEDFRQQLSSKLEVFNLSDEYWEQKKTRGTPPHGLYNNACTSIGRNLYVYGGWDGHSASNSLHRLNVDSLTWTEMEAGPADELPMKMTGCGLVACGSDRLVLFGGYGLPAVAGSKRKGKSTNFVTKSSKSSKSVTPTTAINLTSSEPSQCQSSADEADVGAKGDGGIGGEVVVNGDSAVESVGGDLKDGDVASSGGEGVNGVAKDADASSGGEGVNGVAKDADAGSSGEGVNGVAKDADAGSGGEGVNGAEKDPDTSTGEEEVNKAEKDPDNMSTEGVNGVAKDADASNGGERVNGTAPLKDVDMSSGGEGVIEGDGGSDLVLANEGAEYVSGVEGGVSGEGESGAEDLTLNPLAVEMEAREEEEEEEEEEEDSDVMALIDKQWTNELKIYNLQNNCWSTPDVGGDLPPPSVDFSFSCIEGRLAVLFGGYRPESGASSATYVLNMETWNWTKLGDYEMYRGRREWPVGRDGHASCVLSEGSRPQIMISGGWDKDNRLLSDMWVLDVNRRIWTKLTAPESVGARLWHRVAAYKYSPKLRQLLVFGGCPGAPLTSGEAAWAKLSSTVLVELGEVQKSYGLSSGQFRTQSPHLRNSFRSQGGRGAERAEETWVITDAVSLPLMGEASRRMKEKLLLAEQRALRAEVQAERAARAAREALSKLEALTSKLEKGAFTTQPLYNFSPTSFTSQPGTPKTGEEEKPQFKKEAEEKPFWLISREELEMTSEEVGRGRWGVVKVATHQGKKVAARCLFAPVSAEHRPLFAGSVEQAATLRHPNILTLVGAVLEGSGAAVLVAELAPTNLKKVMEKAKLLNYQAAMIALDVAGGLKFLHTTRPKPLPHGDLTTSSVLLHRESGNLWRARLYHHSTAKYFHQLVTSGDYDDSSHSDTSAFASPTRSATPRVTPPPLATTRGKRLSESNMSLNSRRMSGRKHSAVAPDMLEPTLSIQRDVYTFGLLLVEMCTGTPPLGISLQFLIESITWSEMTALVKLCVELEPSKRPDMDFVVRKLKDIHHAVVSRPSKMTMAFT